MWLYTKIGFFSVTEVPADRNTIQIRSRSKVDMKNISSLCKKLKIHFVKGGEGSDYKYRIYISKDDWKKVGIEIVGMIDYDNFKSEAFREDDPEREYTYHDVWNTMVLWQEGVFSDPKNRRFFT